MTEVLRASHIKPWRTATQQEKVDVYNGLLLMPNLDALFDQALITFNEQGMIEISKQIPKSAWELLGLSKSLRVKLRPKHKRYLQHHHELFRQNQIKH
jgi:putative restriction endonuclease